MKNNENETDEAARKTGRPRKVLVVDDHPIVRHGLCVLVGHEPDLEVCGEASDAASALEAVPRLKPDLMVLDISMAGPNGIELAKIMRDHHPEVSILVLSMHDETLYAERALRAGAKGYVMKQEPPETVLTAIRTILDGGLYVSAPLVSSLLQEFMTGTGPRRMRSGIEGLSDRELEVFEMIGNGLSTREIAAHLHLSSKTVETHRAGMKQKLQIKNATELTRQAIQWVEGRSSKADSP